MTHTEENKLTMYEAVLSLMSSRKEFKTSLPALEKPMWELKHITKDIKTEETNWTSYKNGEKSELALAEDNLLETLLHIGQSMAVFAKLNGLNDLYDLCNINISSLALLSDIELINKTNIIVEKANDNLSSLKEYGITAKQITDLNSRLNYFKTNSLVPETDHQERVVKRWNLSSLFEKADGVLVEEMDNLMETIRDNKPDFYNEYKNKRQIREIGQLNKSIIKNLQI
ncbi:MAG: hypothetical protein JEY94_12105 [Melioribacteraceae bacterium]|nr:hypothetical protein [Melioribacteraceae bacterium]